MDTAQTLGQQYIGTGGDPTGSNFKADWDAAAERWNLLGERAAARGLKLYTHNHDAAYGFLLDSGPARLVAGRARYNMDSDHVQVVGPILFTAADGYRMCTHDVDVDLRGHSLQSRGRVEGRMPLGTFSADQLQVNLPDRRVVLNGRARLHIRQGGLR